MLQPLGILPLYTYSAVVVRASVAAAFAVAVVAAAVAAAAADVAPAMPLPTHLSSLSCAPLACRALTTSRKLWRKDNTKDRGRDCPNLRTKSVCPG